MKHTGEHRENHAPQPGADGQGARSSVPDDFLIAPVDEQFDIDALFRSEDEIGLANPTASGAESRVHVAPEPIPSDRSEAPSPQVAAPAPEPAGEISVGVNREPIADDSSTVPSLSIADLIDNHVRLEWHEAVAIAQHLCHVMARDPAANLHRSLVEPWNVEITNDGEVHVLPGGSSSDPLVKQVGRVLRALLQDSVAPAELRLVASQASFDAPVYSGVDELSAALRYFERPENSGAIRAAFNRGVEAKLSGFQVPARAASIVRPPPVDQNEAPTAAPSASAVRPRSRSRSVSKLVFAASAAAALILVATALVVSRLVRTPGETPVPDTRVASILEPPRRRLETPPTTPAEKPPIEPAPSPPPVLQSVPRPIRSVANAVAPAVPRRPSRPPDGPQAVSGRATPEPRSTTPVSNPFDTNTQQAAELLASGRADEAAMSFDAIVLKNPFYQPDLSRMSPESLSAFRNSKRTILPPMVRRHYQDARAAFDAGDVSLAITEGEQARALLRNLDELDISVEAGDVVADLRNLLTLASAARTAEEERVFTIEDSGVTPPRPLGRQLSAASMSHISLRPTGRLEILVGRSGRVEAVKLDTPMNGYHDRMLVSAVKAWHYKPAVKNGKPVRFSLMMTIRLPDL